jgi:hypothetical protein
LLRPGAQAPLTPAQLDHFDEHGYVVVAQLFDPEQDLRPVVDDYEETLDALIAQWHAEGQLPDNHLCSGYVVQRQHIADVSWPVVVRHSFLHSQGTLSKRARGAGRSGTLDSRLQPVGHSA